MEEEKIKWLLKDFDIEHDKEDFKEALKSFIGISSENLTNQDVIAFMIYAMAEFAKINKKLWATIEYLRDYGGKNLHQKRKTNNRNSTQKKAT